MARAPSQSIQKAELAGRMRVGEPGFVLQSPAPSHPNIKRRESGESSQIKAWRCLPWRPEQLRVLICIPSGAGSPVSPLRASPHQQPLIWFDVSFSLLPRQEGFYPREAGAPRPAAPLYLALPPPVLWGQRGARLRYLVAYVENSPRFGL